jgi:hypothetical protein
MNDAVLSVCMQYMTRNGIAPVTGGSCTDSGGIDLAIRFLRVGPMYWDRREVSIQMRARRGK